MNLTSHEIQVLRGICILTTALFLFNMICIVHNICRYIIGLKIYRFLIVVFYVLILTTTLLRIFESSVRTIDPSHSFSGSKLQSVNICQELALFGVICIGFILIVTMYQLSLSLRLALLQVNASQVRFRSALMWIFCSLAVFCYPVLLGISSTKDKLGYE